MNGAGVICRAPVLDLLSTHRVPVIPAGAVDLLAAIGDDDVGFRELAVVLGRFPTIAARLIALANSPWSSPLVDVSSLELACSRLGLGVVRSTSVALLVSSPFDPLRCPAFDPCRYWSRALTVAEAVVILARHCGEVDPGPARSAGLLHNLGLLWLADQLPEPAGEALEAWRKNPGLSLDRLLIDRVGVGYRHAGACLARAWGLPMGLVNTLEYQGRGGCADQACALARLTGVAVSLVAAAERDGDWTLPGAELAALGLAPADAERGFTEVARQLERIRALAGDLFGS